MRESVIKFIEENISLIEHLEKEPTNTDLFAKLYDEEYNNDFVKELVKVLDSIELDTFEARKDFAFTLMMNMCNEALQNNDSIYYNNVHQQVSVAYNLVGFTMSEFVNLFYKNRLNLNVKLNRTTYELFSHIPNYFIRDINS